MYYIRGGIIDWFSFTLSKEETYKSYVYNSRFNVPDFQHLVNFEKELNDLEKKIRQTIFKEENEYPITIRYFGVPNFDYLEVELCAIAKVENNGSTYAFSENKEFLELYNDGYDKVKEMMLDN